MLNYLLYQAGWFACILGAAWGWPVAGAAIGMGLTALHVWVSRDRPRELILIVVTLCLGLVVESFQLWRGTYAAFASGTVVPWLPPPWLLVMWGQFATACSGSLGWVMRTPLRAGVFGALGGPVAFWAGERLGAVVLAEPVWLGMAWLGMAWAVAMALLSLAVSRTGPHVRGASHRHVA